jgi:hypothetical protein
MQTIIPLAVHCCEPLLEMRDQIAGDDFDPGLGSDDRFELRPFVLSFSVALDLFALGQFLEFRVDLRPLRGFQFELGEPAFVVDRHRRAVGDRARARCRKC